MAKAVTQLEYAKAGIITEQMKIVAKDEGFSPEEIMELVKTGEVIIPANINHKNLHPIGIGKKLRTKINANIGNSELSSDKEKELEKLRVCIKYGADAVMDLSTGKDINEIRELIIKNSPMPVGTVPIYQAATLKKRFVDLTPQDFLDVIEMQAKQGVDFMTIHCGILMKHLPLVMKRTTGIVSRGGSLMASWMYHHEEENPLYTHFDDILEICRKYDVSLSLGDGLRPGCLKDANDEAQFAELKTLGELTLRAREASVQVMIEGPGHVPFNLIAENVKKEEEFCHNAPFYVLGPLVTDIAAGYDHIASAIGGTMAAYSGAAMLCYVTPKEHLGLPDVEDVRVGIVAHKIAAHAADIALGKKGARKRDDAMARARFFFNWEKQFKLALDEDRAREYYQQSGSSKIEGEKLYCTMCGAEFCAMKISHDLCIPESEAKDFIKVKNSN